eukprot:scaffold48_cov311-Pinguiococcus_pyrenoidosus.AAC.167
MGGANVGDVARGKWKQATVLFFLANVAIGHVYWLLRLLSFEDTAEAREKKDGSLLPSRSGKFPNLSPPRPPGLIPSMGDVFRRWDNSAEVGFRSVPHRARRRL